MKTPALVFYVLVLFFATAVAQSSAVPSSIAQPSPTATPVPSASPSSAVLLAETSADPGKPSTTASPAAAKGAVILPDEKKNPVTIAKFDKPPVIDGSLNDPVWRPAAVGLTAKFTPSSALTLDLAIKPDFAQVEADQIVVTESRLS